MAPNDSAMKGVPDAFNYIQVLKSATEKKAPSNTAERHHFCKVLDNKLVHWKAPFQYQSLFSCCAEITSDLCFNLGSPNKSETIQSLACYETFRPRIMKNSLQFYLSSVSYLMKGLARLGLGLTKMKPNYHPALNHYLADFMAFLPKTDTQRERDDKTERILLFRKIHAVHERVFYDEGLPNTAWFSQQSRHWGLGWWRG